MSVKRFPDPSRKKLEFRNYLLVIFSAVLLISTTTCGQAVARPTSTPAPTATLASTLQPGETQHTVKVNSLDRTYLLHIPPGLDSSRPIPVVFALHGFDNEHFFEVTDLQNMTGFGDISDKNGFILIYPSGVSGFWNVGGGCCGTSATDNVDETAFIRKILTDLGSITRVDPKRIYATGFSMGAMLSFWLACDMSDTFAAVAPVAGALLVNPCKPGQPVSIMQVNGKKDTLVPYDGGVGNFMTGTLTFPPVELGISTWAQLDGCTGSAQTSPQGTLGTHTTYSSCKAGSAVDLYILDALGNNWPSQYVLPISQMIWDFFKNHPKH
jgi:polyhydroxybutyrate depolymerase